MAFSVQQQRFLFSEINQQSTDLSTEQCACFS